MQEESLNSRRTRGRSTVSRSSSEVVFDAQVKIAFKRALASCLMKTSVNKKSIGHLNVEWSRWHGHFIAWRVTILVMLLTDTSHNKTMVLLKPKMERCIPAVSDISLHYSTLNKDVQGSAVAYHFCLVCLQRSRNLGPAFWPSPVHESFRLVCFNHCYWQKTSLKYAEQVEEVRQIGSRAAGRLSAVILGKSWNIRVIYCIYQNESRGHWIVSKERYLKQLIANWNHLVITAHTTK